MPGNVNVAVNDVKDVSVDDLDVIAGDADVDDLDFNKTNVDVDNADSVLVCYCYYSLIFATMATWNWWRSINPSFSAIITLLWFPSTL